MGLFGKDSLGTQLYKKAKNGDIAALKLLVEQGAPVDEHRGEDKHDTTALMKVAKLGHVDCLEVLLKAGADKEAKDAVHARRGSPSPEPKAALAGPPSPCPFLLSQCGNTPLLACSRYCTSRNHAACLKVLIAYGANKDARNGVCAPPGRQLGRCGLGTSHPPPAVASERHDGAVPRGASAHRRRSQGADRGGRR